MAIRLCKYTCQFDPLQDRDERPGQNKVSEHIFL
jgi:hypothetical protein